jgi:RNA-binding protein YlmH
MKQGVAKSLTRSVWDEITESIGSDAAGVTAVDYAKASYVLNQLYLAKFQRNFPEFKIHALGIYCENTGAELDEAHVLVHLMNYMYLSCQIGLVP